MAATTPRSRSIRYGNMCTTCSGIDAVPPTGASITSARAADILGWKATRATSSSQRKCAHREREAAEIEARWPKVLRRAGIQPGFREAPKRMEFAQLLVVPKARSRIPGRSI